MQNTSTSSATIDPLVNVIPFLELPQRYPQFFGAKNTAAWLLRHRESNGLAEFIRWVGRVGYIDCDDFAKWFKSRSQRAPPPRTAAQLEASRTNVATARATRAKARRSARSQP